MLHRWFCRLIQDNVKTLLSFKLPAWVCIDRRIENGNIKLVGFGGERFWAGWRAWADMTGYDTATTSEFRPRWCRYELIWDGKALRVTISTYPESINTGFLLLLLLCRLLNSSLIHLLTINSSCCYNLVGFESTTFCGLGVRAGW
jgi:hypothetical protein